MNRDNVLFALCGLLAGFIAGYFLGAGRPPLASAPPAAAAATAAASPAPSPEVAQRARELKAAVVRDPDNADLRTELANTEYDLNDWSAAAADYEKVLPRKGSDPNLLTDLGSCYRNLGDFRRAVETYEKAQKLDAHHIQSLLNLTLVYAFDLKDPEKAQKYFDELKRQHPDIPRLEDLQLQISTLRAARS